MFWMHTGTNKILFDVACGTGDLAKLFLDKTKNSIVIQITALRRDVDKMAKNLRSLGLISISRTGAVAMTRGSEVFK